LAQKFTLTKLSLQQRSALQRRDANGQGDVSGHCFFRPFFFQGILFSGHSVQRTDFVARRVAQVRKVQFAMSAGAHTGRVFTGDAAVGYAGSMPSVCSFWSVGTETDGAAIAVTGRLTINGFAECKNAGFGAVKAAALIVDEAGWTTQRAKHRIIKCLGFFDVIGAKHDVTEHISFPLFCG
jgi:hypothetical protein